MSDSIPHFALPFRFVMDPHGEIHADVNDQDSIEDVRDCVTAIVKTPLGYREELPEFGVRDMTFSEGGIDVSEIEQAVTLWEPRADIMIEEDKSMLQYFIDQATINPGTVNPVVPNPSEQDA